MENRSKVIDTFQIVGFAISTGVAIALVAAQIDPMQSMVIGLMLAILTQLFDLQLRHTTSEERVLQANALSQTLYRDAELLKKFRQIVDDYYCIKDGWFQVFKLRAEDTLSDCHRVLRSMAGGTMEPPPRSQLGLSVTAFKFAQTSIKQVTDYAAIKDAVKGMRGWYMKSMEEIMAHGVRMTLILILSREELKEISTQIQAEAMPIGAYIALSDELPTDLDENFLIMDDGVVSFMERLADGTLGERTISIIPVEVERMVKRFDQVMRYANKAEDVLAEANQQPAVSVR
jgi:hypothetical protein